MNPNQSDRKIFSQKITHNQQENPKLDQITDHMFRKRRPISQPRANDRFSSLGSAPISDEMYNSLERLKECTANGEEAGEMLEETIKQLIVASLEQLSAQRKNSPENFNPDNAK